MEGVMGARFGSLLAAAALCAIAGCEGIPTEALGSQMRGLGGARCAANLECADGASCYSNAGGVCLGESPACSLHLLRLTERPDECPQRALQKPGRGVRAMPLLDRGGDPF